MDKKTLFERNKKDSKEGDEFQISVKLKGYTYALWGVLIFALSLWILAEFGVIQGSIIVMNHTFAFQSILPAFMILSASIYHLYRYYFLRKKGDLWYGLLMIIGFLAFLYRFLITGLNT